jgi:hypothetical protein
MSTQMLRLSTALLGVVIVTFGAAGFGTSPTGLTCFYKDCLSECPKEMDTFCVERCPEVDKWTFDDCYGCEPVHKEYCTDPERPARAYCDEAGRHPTKGCLPL